VSERPVPSSLMTCIRAAARRLRIRFLDSGPWTSGRRFGVARGAKRRTPSPKGCSTRREASPRVLRRSSVRVRVRARTRRQLSPDPGGRNARTRRAANTTPSGAPAVRPASRATELVALSAAGADQRRTVTAIELTAKTLDVNIDNVGERVVVLVPDVLGDVRAADHLSCAPREVFEQTVLAAGQFQLASVDPDPLTGNIDCQRSYLDPPGGERTAIPPGECPQRASSSRKSNGLVR
jgi:hypothetical protein